MNDEHIGFAGWLLADLALVLAIVFLAMVPGADPAAATAARRPNTPTPIPLAQCLAQSNFQFDQIVVTDVESGARWDDIAAGHVRKNLIKAQEVDDPLGRFEPLAVSAYLQSRQKDGWKIALVETFGWTAPEPFTTTVAENVNSAFITGFRDGQISQELLLFNLDDQGRWLAHYGSSQIARGTARINIYFVRQDCPPS